MMDTITAVIEVVASSLQLGDRAGSLNAESPLLGAIPEFDSMAVVTVVTGLEERFGFVADDDELDADVFRTVGSLAEFVAQEEMKRDEGHWWSPDGRRIAYIAQPGDQEDLQILDLELELLAAHFTTDVFERQL